MPWPFRSLTSQLIATYAFVVAICLLLAGLAALLVINRYEESQAQRSVCLVITDAIARLPNLTNRQLTSRQTLNQLRLETQLIRGQILLLDENGQVLEDSNPQNELDNATLPLPPRNARPSAACRLPILNYTARDRQRYVFAITPLPVQNPFRVLADKARFLAVAVPLQDVRLAGVELWGRLLLVGVVAMLLSIPLGLLLSRSVLNPIIGIKRAAEEVAQGHYDQSLPEAGVQEVRSLAHSFNTMSEKVSRSRQAQKDFLANVSHDLKTPLTSIRGYAQAIQDGTINSLPDAQNAAGVILEETGRMTHLVNDLLELSRLESGQLPLARDTINLAEVLPSWVHKYDARAANAGIQLMLQSAVPANGEMLPCVQLKVRGDEPRLEQIFTNLLENALYYTPAGGRVEVVAGHTSEGQIEVRISDTGQGIPPEELPRIFERFYRVDKSRSKTNGSGLGLAIAKELVEAHGGAIHAASQPDFGTSFTINFPAAKPESP
ncbi:MAG: HAMP domain-containing protein [Chloroflexi bacterium]|nr:HAMP domain-containing protein [Chloroflexota bacterium]